MKTFAPSFRSVDFQRLFENTDADNDFETGLYSPLEDSKWLSK